MKILHEKCEKIKSDDKKLPSDSFLVTYKEKDEAVLRCSNKSKVLLHQN